jgi:hypothetical protein
MNMKAVCSFETPVSAYKTARCHNTEDYNLNNSRRVNLITHIFVPSFSLPFIPLLLI